MKFQRRFLSISILVLAFAFACTQTNGDSEPGISNETSDTQMQIQTSDNAPYGGMRTSLQNNCPMALDGVNVHVSDMENGIALTFETDKANIGDLRRRVQHMSQMYDSLGGHHGMTWHSMGRQGSHGHGMMREQWAKKMHGIDPMPTCNTTIENMEKGARIELIPKDASRLDALRDHVRWHQHRMQSGECWMLEE